MADPYILNTRAVSRSGPSGLGNADVTRVLAENETPGTFEQFFRFIGRPGFATRSLLTGDLVGAGKNVLQFANEMFLGGMGALNPNFTLTGALNLLPGIDGLPTDFTSKEDRPEFTDALKRWGVADPRYMGFGEKLVLDIAGGIITDPLSLVGGAPKGVTTAALQKAAGASAMRRAAYVGMREGGGAEVQAMLSRAVDSRLGETVGALARRPSAGAQATARALGQFNHTNLEDFVKRAPEFGLDPVRASRLVLKIQDTAAERVFFENAAKAGVDMSRAVRTVKNPLDLNENMTAFFSPDNPKALMEVPITGLGDYGPDLLRNAVQSGTIGAIEIPGQAKRVYFGWRQHQLAKNLQAKYESLTAAQSLADTPTIARLHKEIGVLLGHSDDAIKDTLRQNGFDPFLFADVGAVEKWKRFYDEIPDKVVDDGIKALQARGMTGDGISYFNPFKWEWKSVQWSSIFQLTAPGLMLSLAKKHPQTAKVADQIGDWVNAAAGVVMNRIYDRFHPVGGVDPRYSEKARKAIYASFTAERAIRDTTVKTFFEKLPPNVLDEMGKATDVMAEQYQAAIHAGQHETPEVYAEVARRLAALGDTRALDPADPVVARMAEKVLADELMSSLKLQISGYGDDALTAFETWRKGMSEIPPYMRHTAKWEKHLKQFDQNPSPAWKDALENPFYLPHQMSLRLHQMLDEGLFSSATAAKINDVFTSAKTYPNRTAFLNALEGLAEDVGLALDDGPEGLQLLNMGELYYRRMVSHELTKTRQFLYQEAQRTMERLGKRGKGTASSYQFYISRVLHPTAAVDPVTGEVMAGGSARKNFFSKVLGGGRFTVPMSEANAVKAAKYLEASGSRVVRNRAGSSGLSFRFPGINAWWKPLLTSHPLNPRFVVRNIFSSALMMQFIPGFGAEGWKQVTPGLLNSGMVRTLLKLRNWKDWDTAKNTAWRALHGPLDPLTLSDGDYVAAAVSFLTGRTQAERDAGLELLKASKATVGPYSWEQVAPALRMVMGGPSGISPADLSSGTEIMPKLMESTMSLSLATRADQAKISKARQWWRDYIGNGERISNEVEARFRATAMLGLLARGVDPYEAARQVTNAFVDYSKQSMVERGIRDVFPFARFMIGSLAWGKGTMERPGAALPAILSGRSPLSASLVTPQTLGLAQRAATATTEDEAGGGQFLPGEAAGTIALPLPWKDSEGNVQFLTSLGIPHEATLQIAGAVAGGPDAIRKNILGSIQPAIRYPAEAITDRSFYFGSDFGSYRKAPGYLEPFAERIPGRDGKPDRYEIEGGWNELMNALPSASFQSTFDKWWDDRRSFTNKLVSSTTGFKTTSVDFDREVKRRVAAYLKDKVDSGQIGEVQAFFTRIDPEEVPEDLKIMLDALAQERAASRKQNPQRGRGLY